MASTLRGQMSLAANQKSEMKVLVLNGSETAKSTVDTVSDYLVDFLRIKGHEVDVLVLRDQDIGSCLGCFSCWLRTPGKCVINDAASDLPKKFMQSDAVFLLTPVTFGMYSYQLKKALDRYACPLLLPFFTKIDGETHHKLRYEKYPIVVAIGVLPENDEESEHTFKTLVRRNGVNLHTPTLATIVYSNDDAEVMKEKVVSTLSKIGA